MHVCADTQRHTDTQTHTETHRHTQTHTHIHADTYRHRHTCMAGMEARPQWDGLKWGYLGSTDLSRRWHQLGDTWGGGDGDRC